MKTRSIGLCIVLSIITCGIYAIYWFVCLNDDINYVTGEAGASGGMAVLFTILTCGIYGIYWAYKMGEKLDRLRMERGGSSGSLSILYLVLSIVGLSLVGYALMQSELNQYGSDGSDIG